MSNIQQLLALPIQKRVENCLDNPSILSKCQNLSQILLEVGSKEGCSILKAVVDNIFGVSVDNPYIRTTQNGFENEGWPLHIINYSQHYSEYLTLRSFLSATGPVLNLAYRLCQDPAQAISIPTNLLPVKLESSLQNGNLSDFYSSKLRNVPDKTKEIVFNPFEYYMFNFCHFLIKCSQKTEVFSNGIKESLYPTLIEDYFKAYLPCDGSLPPGPAAVPVSPRRVIGMLSPAILSPQLNLLMSPIATPRCADNSTFQHENFQSAVQKTSSPIHRSNPTDHSSIWTSQTIFQIMLEVWVCCCIQDSTKQNFNLNSSSYPAMESIYIPSVDQIRAVRMLVKHVHYFSNSVKMHQPVPLDAFRKSIVNSSRKMLYLFIKHLFIHWPLDSSFRTALEVWLSYIQPWRYENLDLDKNGSIDETDRNISPEPKWLFFVAQNLLSYTHIFRLLLHRLIRLDMTSPKNAQIMQRVSKVFSQRQLQKMIHDLEDKLDVNQFHPNFGGFLGGVSVPLPTSPIQDHTLGDSPLSPQVIVQALRWHIVELEGSHFNYSPMFSEDNYQVISHLMSIANNARVSLKDELENITGAKSEKQKNTDIFSKIYSFLFEFNGSSENQTSVEEINRGIQLLDISISNFALIFKLPTPGGANETNLNSSRESLLTPDKLHVPDLMETSHGPELTDYGRYQILNGLRRLDLKYEGDPDLKPISDYEFAFLVKLLHIFSSFVNKKFENKITDLYNRQDYYGSLARVVFKAPTTLYELKKNREFEDLDCASSRKVAKNLPPRLSLRAFAHKSVAALVLTIFLLLKLFGISFSTTFLQFMVPFVITYVFVKAFFRNIMSKRYQDA